MLGPDRPRLVGKVRSRHARHGEIGDEKVELVVGLQDVERRRSVGSLHDPMSHFGEIGRGHRSYFRIVIDEKNADLGRVGGDHLLLIWVFLPRARPLGTGKAPRSFPLRPRCWIVTVPPDCWARP